MQWFFKNGQFEGDIIFCHLNVCLECGYILLYFLGATNSYMYIYMYVYIAIN